MGSSSECHLFLVLVGTYGGSHICDLMSLIPGVDMSPTSCRSGSKDRQALLVSVSVFLFGFVSDTDTTNYY